MWGQELTWQNVPVWQDIIMIWVSVNPARCSQGEVRVVGVISNVWWQKHTDWGNAFNIRKYNFSNCDSWKFIPLHTTFHQSIHVFNKHISVPSVCWNKCVNCSNVTDTKISQWEFHSIPKDGYHGSNRDLQFIFIFNFIFYQVFSGPALNPDKCELIVFVGWLAYY